MEDKKYFKTLYKKDDVEVRILSLSTVEDALNLFKFEIQKKKENRYIVKYIPKVKIENLEIICTNHSGSFYDKTKEKSMRVDKYNFFVNVELKFQLEIVYPYNLYCFHNHYQHTFVIFE
ncbi:hypothetical protein [Persephonella hydrogeniphila]|nr:hypothetical protein [Persephonella hydrogeniphila]